MTTFLSRFIWICIFKKHLSYSHNLFFPGRTIVPLSRQILIQEFIEESIRTIRIFYHLK